MTTFKRWTKWVLMAGLAGLLLYGGVALGLVLLSPTADTKPKPMDDRYEEVLQSVKDSGPLPEKEPFRARDGAQLNYYGYPSDQDVNRVLVLVHGSGFHSVYLQPLADALRDAAAAHVYTPNLRGHGPQVVRRGDVDYIGQLEDDLMDFMAHLRERHPDASFYLGGHSLGGGLVVRLAGSSRELQVEGYVLLAPFLHPDVPANRSGEAGWASPNVPRLLGLSMLNRVGVKWFNSYSVMRFHMPEKARDGTETPTYSYRLLASFMARSDYRNDLAKLQGDLLVLLGDRDRFFDPDAYTSLFQNHVPHASVRVLNGRNHMSLVTDAKTGRLITDWMNTRSD